MFIGAVGVVTGFAFMSVHSIDPMNNMQTALKPNKFGIAVNFSAYIYIIQLQCIDDCA